MKRLLILLILILMPLTGQAQVSSLPAPNLDSPQGLSSLYDFIEKRYYPVYSTDSLTVFIRIRYEYKVISGMFYQTGKLQGILTAQSAAGWELVSALPVFDVAWNSYYRTIKDDADIIKIGYEQTYPAMNYFFIYRKAVTPLTEDVKLYRRLVSEGNWPPTPEPPPVDNRININTADAQTLDSLPGIGPTLAGRIIQYRTQNGPFTDIEQLSNVSGIGTTVMNNIRSLIRVE